LKSPHFVLLSLVLSTSVALAEPEPRLNLTLQAPEGCEIAQPIEREVGRILRPTDTTSSPLAVNLHVFRQAERFRLVIETSDEDKGRFRRELESGDCRDFVRPTAVIIALAINPQALDAAPEPSSQPNAGPDRPIEPPAKPTANEARSVDRAVGEPQRDALSDHPSRAKRPVVPFVRAAQVIDFGALPAAGLGPMLGGGIDWGWFRAEVSGMYLPPRRAVVSTFPERGGEIELIAATLSVCGVPYRARLELAGCVGSDLGVLRGEGFGVRAPETGTGTWLAAKAGALVGYSPHRVFAVVLHADVVRRIGDAEFELEGIGPVHRPCRRPGRRERNGRDR